MSYIEQMIGEMVKTFNNPLSYGVISGLNFMIAISLLRKRDITGAIIAFVLSLISLAMVFNIIFSWNLGGF